MKKFIIKIHKMLIIIFIVIINSINPIICSTSAYNQTSTRITKDRLEKIKENGVLTIASSNDIPFAYIDPNSKELTGIDGEIITEVAKRLKINKVKIVVVPFTNLLEQLNNDDSIDIVVDGMSITDERKKEALFTNIWYKESEAVIVPKISKINFQEDLKNAVVGVQKGTVFLDLAQKLKTEELVKDVIIFENQPELLFAITTGKVDAGITDSIVASYLISHDNNLYLKILSPYKPISVGNISSAVRKSDVTLANAINQQINEMKQDKTILNILQKYGLPIDYFVSVKEN